ncbi:MAG: redoxin domain-containing protein [Archangiaceae bacterium]|nr:redoxin domain-containing protein [Archangiaceae bacterium]
MKLRPGDLTPSFEAISTTGAVITSASLKGKFTILSFHRYVGCPLCNLAIRSFAKQAPGVLGAGLGIVNVFESSDANLKQAITIWGDMDFPVVADPSAKLFNLFGVESSFVGSLRTMGQVSLIMESIRTPKPPIARDGAEMRMPASFFIAPDLRVFDVHYGKHKLDHLTPETTQKWLNIVQKDSTATAAGVKRA